MLPRPHIHGGSNGAGKQATVWVGTRHTGMMSGIYRVFLDQTEGVIGRPLLAARLDNVGYLALGPGGDTLYASGKIAGQAVVVSYRISNQTDGPIVSVSSSVQTAGVATHLAISPAGDLLVTAHYRQGAIAVFPVDAKGELGEQSQYVELSFVPGNSNPRQQAPHPHWVGFSDDMRFILTAELGADRLAVFRVDHGEKALQLHRNISMGQESGPRYIQFHREEPWAYLLSELDNTIGLLDVSEGLDQLGTVETVPAAAKATLSSSNKPYASELKIHPAGNMLVAAIRGANSISVFKLDPSDGSLILKYELEIRGSKPRSFDIDESGNWLLIGAEASDTISSYSIEPGTQSIEYNGSIQALPHPGVVVFQKR